MNNRFKIFILSIIAIFQHASAQVPTQEQCQQADAQLNQVYQQLRGTLNDAQKQQLKQAQRDWIKKRDAFVAANPGNPQGAFYQATIQRAEELSGFIGRTSQAPQEISASITPAQQSKQKSDDPSSKSTKSPRLNSKSSDVLAIWQQFSPDEVDCVDVSLSDGLVATGSRIKQGVRLYDLKTERLIREFSVGFPVQSVKFAAREKSIIVTGRHVKSDAQIALCDYNGKKLKQYSFPTEQDSRVLISPVSGQVVLFDKDKRTCISAPPQAQQVASANTSINLNINLLECSNSDASFFISNFPEGLKKRHLFNKLTDRSFLCPSHEGKLVATIQGSELKVCDLSSEQNLSKIDGYIKSVGFVKASPKGRYLVAVPENETDKICIYEPETLKTWRFDLGGNAKVRDVVWSGQNEDGIFVLAEHSEDKGIKMFVLRYDLGSENKRLELGDIPIKLSQPAETAKIVEVGSNNRTIIIRGGGYGGRLEGCWAFSLINGKWEKMADPSTVPKAVGHSGLARVYLNDVWDDRDDHGVRFENHGLGSISLPDPPTLLESAFLSEELERIVLYGNHRGGGYYAVYDFHGRKLPAPGVGTAINGAAWLDANTLLLSSPAQVTAIDVSNGTEKIVFDRGISDFRYESGADGGSFNPSPFVYVPAVCGNLIYAPNYDGSIAVLKRIGKNEIQHFYDMAFGDTAGFIVRFPDNYYLTRGLPVAALHTVRSGIVYPFDQFDLRLNRPDIVLERLGAPKEAIETAKSLREKRLKRMGVTEEMLKPDFHLPDLQIVGDVPATTPKDQLDFQIKATDDKYPLDRLRVYVNNVPVNGRDGELLRDQKTQSLEKTIPIKLAAGRNKIQVSVLNSAGAESLYANAEVNCTADRPKPKLYAVALGVSQYDRPEWCLKYAAKDATDLINKLQAKAGSSYSEVKPLLLTDKDVTKESASKIKEFLSGATIDDTVLIFMAGHGLLDDKYDYYFGTTDIDPAKPSERGMPYEAIDTILADVPSLKKALLMDTCHAGELDEDEKKELATSDGSASPSASPDASSNSTNSSPLAGKVAMRSIGTRGMQVKAVEGAKGKSDWYEKLQDMFVDLRRGSGATVISSSQGAEYAFESSDQSNGLFTYALMEALDGKTTPNKDGQITISSIGDYVKKRVQDLTKGKQNPNLRGVNLEEDFTLGSAR